MPKRVLGALPRGEKAAVFACLISERGFEVNVVVQEQELGAALDQTTPDLIVLDAGFEGGSTLDIVRRIRSDAFGNRHSRKPLIVIDPVERHPAKALMFARAEGLIDDLLQPPNVLGHLMDALVRRLGEPEDDALPPLPVYAFERLYIPRLLLAAHQIELTGSLSLNQADRVKKIYFDEGQLVSASSSVTTDRIGNLLIAKGLISENQLNEALIAASESGRKIGQELVFRGWLDARRLDRSLLEQSTLILRSVFAWDSFEACYSFLQTARPAEVTLSEPIFELIRRSLSQELSRKDFDAVLKRDAPFAAVNVGTPISIRSLSFTEGEKALLRTLDGTKQVADVVAESSLPESEAQSFLTALVLSDVVVLTKEPNESPMLADALIDQSRAMAAYTEEFFSSDTVATAPGQPPPITSDELAEELRRLDEGAPDSLEDNPEKFVTPDITHSDLEGLQAGNDQPVRYLTMVGLVLVLLGMSIGYMLLFSNRPPSVDELVNRKRVDQIGGDLKPLFTEAIDLYQAGMERLVSGKPGDLEEAKKLFLLSLQIVPDYEPAQKALEQVEKQISDANKSKKKPAKASTAPPGNKAPQ